MKVIIFSGFDEFEYAKEAIKIEAEEYILKPINSNELREVFERIKVNLDKELDEKEISTNCGNIIWKVFLFYRRIFILR